MYFIQCRPTVFHFFLSLLNNFITGTLWSLPNIIIASKQLHCTVCGMREGLTIYYLQNVKFPMWMHSHYLIIGGDPYYFPNLPILLQYFWPWELILTPIWGYGAETSQYYFHKFVAQKLKFWLFFFKLGVLGTGTWCLIHVLTTRSVPPPHTHTHVLLVTCV